MLPMCLSNCKAMRWYKPPISLLRDFMRSYDRTSYVVLKRGPGHGPDTCQHYVALMSVKPWPSVGHYLLPDSMTYTREIFLHLDKITAITRTAFSNALSWMKWLASWFQFHWCVILKVQLTISEHWFSLIAWCRIGNKSLSGPMLIQFTDACHDDVIKWKHFPRYWPFVRGIHRSPVKSPHKGQWCGALMFSLIYA